MLDIYREKIQDSHHKLQEYCEAKQWRGYDPYDGLNSRLFQATPLRNNRNARLALIQSCKRSPINLRKLLLVDNGTNPKGLGLFLSAYSTLYNSNGGERYRNIASKFIEDLKEMASCGYSGICWGYDFDWQAKAFFQPRFIPTVVATSFIAQAFLDAHEAFRNQEFLDIAASSCDFIINDLNWIYDENGSMTSYSPLDSTQVYNATMLAAGLLARVYGHTGKRELKDLAVSCARSVCANQNDDGSWRYSPLPYHDWIDNFHTGFNLVSLRDVIMYCNAKEFEQNLSKGLQFYKEHLFLDDGTPRYYHNRIYPIDTHSAAQGIMTFLKEGDIELAGKIALWAIDNMQDEDGYFYYQIRKRHKNKIPYMRWSQAFMLKALSEFIVASKHRTNQESAGLCIAKNR